MQKKKQAHIKIFPSSKEKIINEHRSGERREKESPGFTYITSVGWICRREKTRRKDNNFLV